MKRTLPIFSTLVLTFLLSAAVFAQSGTLDTTFGYGGKMSTYSGIPGENVVSNSALQSDGKFIIIGSTDNYKVGSALVTARYLPNGFIDTSFGTGGYVTTLVRKRCLAGSVAVQKDGKIVVAGSTYDPLMDYGASDILIVRYNENGSLDSTFDNDGIKVENVASVQNVHALLIQSDGKIIVGGSFARLEDVAFGLARFNTDGSLDQTYGVSGFAITPTLRRGELLDMKFIDNEDIIAVGRNTFGVNCVIARYSNNGEIVKSFGPNGTGLIMENYGTGSQLNKCVISKNNDIYIGGAFYNEVKHGTFISKYNSNGVADDSFGVKGKVNRDLGTESYIKEQFFSTDIVIDHNDNLLIGYGVGGYTNRNFGIASYNLSGILNTSFGKDGYFSVDFEYGEDYFKTMLVQSDNKIIMAGDKGTNILTRINNTALALSTIDFDKTANEINISPNPVNDSPTLSLQLKQSATLNVDLYDVKGVLISNLVKNKNYSEGFTSEQLDLSGKNLSKGIYFLKINGDGKVAKTIKIVK